MSAVIAAEAAVVRAKLLSGAPVTIFVGARLGPNGTLDLTDASGVVLSPAGERQQRAILVAEFDRIIADNSIPASPSEGTE